ncbi:CIC11C00000000426 [Sungouiella intermedia]|uniref:CIC11C00000000426 n=1 Tax=Sungouiella intermedia TaxID=45354 RepID=A0A1L0FW84_9ASCO|nr:CIC11C00000000426 [[Candida] intermedia]
MECQKGKFLTIRHELMSYALNMNSVMGIHELRHAYTPGIEEHGSDRVQLKLGDGEEEVKLMTIERMEGDKQ